jgi:hypothetical protein
VTQFVVSLPCPERALSPNAHIHWRDKAAATKVARKQSWYWFQRHKPKKWKVGPVILEIEYRFGIDHEGLQASRRTERHRSLEAEPRRHGGRWSCARRLPRVGELRRVRIVQCIQGENPPVVITVRLDSTAKQALPPVPAPKGHIIPNAPRGRKGPNKLTKTVKEAFETVFKDLQKDPKNPSTCALGLKRSRTSSTRLASKLIPTEVKGEMNHTVTPNINCVVEAMAGAMEKIIVNTEPLGVDGRKPD